MSSAAVPAGAPEPLADLAGPRAPLLLAAVAFSAGILFANFAWRPTPWWRLLALLTVAAAGYCAQRRPLLAYACAALLLATLGALDLQLRLPRLGNELAPYLDGNEATVTAHLVRDGMVAERGAEQRQIVDVETEQIEARGSTQALRARIRLSIYSREEHDSADDEADAAPQPPRQFVYGDRLRFTARLRPAHNYGNPGSFDYRGYLAERGIAALASVNQERVEALPGTAGSAPYRWRSRARRALLERIAALWPPRQAALISAMLIGETASLDRATRTEFQRTGVFHILVVSGMNVALLAAVVFFSLRRLGVGELLTTLATVVVCAAYAFLTEGDPPVTRAAIMVAIYLTTRLLYRDRAALNALGTAALLILVLDPHALFEASFQLSFLAVLAITGIAVPLLERTSAPYRSALSWLDSLAYDQTLPPRMAQFRLDLRLVAERMGRFLGTDNGAKRGVKRAQWLLVNGARVLLTVWDTLLVSAVMQIALALPMAWYFHRAMVVGLPANILVTPLVALLVPLAALAALVALVSMPVAAVLAVPVSLLLGLMLRALHVLGALRAADTRVATPATLVVVGTVATLLFVLFAVRISVRRNRWFALAGVAALTASAAWIAFVPPQPQLRPGVLEITAIDVGQGDALLIVTPQGRTLLIDAGGAMRPGSEFDVGEEVVSAYLWGRGFTRLDAIALTHAHADHIGGLPAIIRNFRPRTLWVGINPPTRVYEALLAAARQGGVTIERHVEGDQFDFGGASVRVVSPAPDWQVARNARNNDSLGMLLTFGATSALLEGDAEKKVEKRIAAGDPRADLLKVGHHGSATSTIPELLAAVQPKVAVISVGYRSPFGHPRSEVLERLENARVLTHRTDVEGAVTFILDGKAVTVVPRERR